MIELKSLLQKKVSAMIHPRDQASGATRKAVDLAPYLNQFPCQDEIIGISNARFFQHEEDAYDTQYDNDQTTLAPGQGVLNLLAAYQADFNGAVVEIGCGTGLMSRGLLADPRISSGANRHFHLTLITDPSPKFVSIAKRKLSDIPNSDQTARFAILLAEDLNKLPANSLSAVVMRSVLHHVWDIPPFLEMVSTTLAPGGLFLVEEPCSEGFILMGALAQFIPAIVEQAGHPLTPPQQAQVQTFVDTMKFYVNRLADKSTSEDKHVFRVDELMKQAEQAGLTTDFYPNLGFAYFSTDHAKFSPQEAAKEPFSFSNFLYSYLKYCMQFDEALLQLISEHFMGYCAYMDSISLNGNAPYSTGVFVFKK